MVGKHHTDAFFQDIFGWVSQIYKLNWHYHGYVLAFSVTIVGSRDGAVVRALASQQCGSGSIPTRYHMWVEFVVGSRPCYEGFSPGSPVFLPP